MATVIGKGFQGTLSRDIGDYPDGLVIPVDKPYRWTSADVIRKIKYLAIRHFGKKNLKVGHAGTLDPLATGVLIVCMGKATRLAQSIQDGEKEYLASVSFGATTASYDLEKPLEGSFPYSHIGRENLLEALGGLCGTYGQIAPLFSAKSVEGVRAYELARKEYAAAMREGRPFDPGEVLHRNMVTVSEAELVSWSPSGGILPSYDGPANMKDARIKVNSEGAAALPQAVVRIRCSKGTYIRAFARDLGEALGSGAFLSGLIRSRCGSFSLSDAVSVNDAARMFYGGCESSKVIQATPGTI